MTLESKTLNSERIYVLEFEAFFSFFSFFPNFEVFEFRSRFDRYIYSKGIGTCSEPVEQCCRKHHLVIKVKPAYRFRF